MNAFGPFAGKLNQFLKLRHICESFLFNRFIDSDQILTNRTSSTQVYVTHFRVSRDPFRKAYSFSARLNGRERVVSKDLIDVGLLRGSNGVFMFGGIHPKAVEDHE